MKKNRRSLAVVFTAALAFVGLWFSGWSIASNTSISMPKGLYLSGPLGEIQRGAVVSVCIPDGDHAELYLARDYIPASPRCPSGAAPVMKPVFGVPGDEIRLTVFGVEVNGRLVPNSGVKSTDSQGLPIDHLPIGWFHRLEPGQFFIMSTHVERSLDSRYYGPVSRADILTAIYPVVTF